MNLHVSSYLYARLPGNIQIQHISYSTLKKVVENSSINPQGCVVTILQCLAACNLVNSPCEVHLSWLLYYLARPQIVVAIDDLQKILHDFVVSMNYPYKPLDPIHVLESLCTFDIISRYINSVI